MGLVALLACNGGSCRNAGVVEASNRSPRVRASAGSSNHSAHADTGALEVVAPEGSSLARAGLGSPDPAVRAEALRALANARPSAQLPSLHQIVAPLGDEALYEKTTRVDGYGRKDGGAYQPGRVVTVQEPVGDLAAVILVKMVPQVVDPVSGALTSSNAKARERARLRACADWIDGHRSRPGGLDHGRKLPDQVVRCSCARAGAPDLGVAASDRRHQECRRRNAASARDAIAC